jgi:two-component sensor histidine kinase/GAF domain-containing protein
MYGNNSDITDDIKCDHEGRGIQRCNLILEGINLITSTGLQKTKKEEQINACLSVALEITGSQIGFIGIVDLKGLLKEVAVSDKVNKCNKYDKSGKQLSYRNFILNCLYGNIIDIGKSFFTNCPLSHTDSVGVQYNYPSMTSFLGVPLIEEGKAIGVLAVANREEGYSCEQREDLEAIAPTVTQALKRIKEEQELKYTEKMLQDAYEQIQTQTDELQMQSDELQMKNEILLTNSNKIRVINAELKVKSEEVQNANETLEKKVKQRTEELEKAYVSLKESKKSLVDAQKIAHLGSYDWNVATNEEYWSDESYRIFGLDLQFDLNHNMFLSRINPEDLGYVNHAINEALNGKLYNIDYRIILPDGKERVIHSQGEVIFDEKNTPDRMRGVVQDITELREVEEKLSIIESVRKREIHHRIKNNLQVISSLLDLQAEKFRNRENIKDSEILEAFRESQNRVISMALIHEELYKGENADNINFSSYIEKLTDNLFQIYKRENTEISFNIDLEGRFSFDMDTAVPLGIIVNEIISNSFKHAFIGKDKGEIKIRLWREEKDEFKYENYRDTNLTLAISDDGIGIPDDIDIKDLNSLGLQLVTTLVDQLDGELEITRNNGTEFIIRFIVTQNCA